MSAPTVVKETRIMIHECRLENWHFQVFSLTEDGGWDEEGELKQGRQDALFFSLQEENLLCDNTIS